MDMLHARLYATAALLQLCIMLRVRGAMASGVDTLRHKHGLQTCKAEDCLISTLFTPTLQNKLIRAHNKPGRNPCLQTMETGYDKMLRCLTESKR